ncbi:MAG: hypothetical protein MR423_01345 [Firmicutes bacterium]|nr:hypothetical protein [Bacillota bacterium]MDY3658764.1 hypothetical protein [Eubacteriales bacterium]
MKQLIDWEEYCKAFDEMDCGIFNECIRDLHNMKMKEGLCDEIFGCEEYSSVLRELEAFDQTNFDYFEYEKEITIGETN